jgi:hypothetical protein
MRKPLDIDLSHAWAPIARALTGLQFGAVEITVHNGRIVQIERREKLRLDAPVQGHSLPTTTPSD